MSSASVPQAKQIALFTSDCAIVFQLLLTYEYIFITNTSTYSQFYFTVEKVSQTK